MSLGKRDSIDDAKEACFIGNRTEQGPCDMPQLNERDQLLYERFLGIDFESLEGKNVLNIGGGITGLAEKQMCAHGANVCALSPIFADTGLAGRKIMEAYGLTTWQKLLKCLGGGRKSVPVVVAGVAEDLPLLDSCMDVVLALYSVPLYSDDNSAVCREILRVLATNGKAVLFPVSGELVPSLQSILHEIGAENIQFEEIEEDTDRVYPNQKTYRLTFRKSMVSPS